MSKQIPPAPQLSRIQGLDVARGVALIAMAIYHFVWDLELFGYLEPGTATTVPWKPFARSIAFSFLFLVGMGLVLATRNGIDRKRYGIRLLKIAGAAAIITVATAIATPDGFIFFGILHHIALASVVGLLVVRLPLVVQLLVAAASALVPVLLKGAVDVAPLAFLGLNATPVRSNDFVPFFPWFGAVALGIAVMTWLSSRLDRLPRMPGNLPGTKPLSWLGRHSLAFYLVHQPILIGLLYGWTQLGTTLATR